MWVRKLYLPNFATATPLHQCRCLVVEQAVWTGEGLRVAVEVAVRVLVWAEIGVRVAVGVYSGLGLIFRRFDIPKIRYFDIWDTPQIEY